MKNITACLWFFSMASPRAVSLEVTAGPKDACFTLSYHLWLVDTKPAALGLGD